MEMHNTKRRTSSVPWFRSSFRFGLGTVVAVALLDALTYWVMLPLHAAGRWQLVGDFVNSLRHLLRLPVEWLTEPVLGLWDGIHETVPVWWINFALDVPIWLLAGFLLRAFWLWAGRPGQPAPAPTATPEPAPVPAAGVSRRRFLQRGLQVAGGGMAAGAVYGLWVEPRRFEVSRLVFPVRGLPPSLNGLRLVQLTDLHHGPWLSRDQVRQFVQASNALDPDLVCLTGDYVLQSPDYIAPAAAELAGLRARIGIVAVLGNHDWLQSVDQSRAEFARAGLPLIDNDRLILTPDRRLVEEAQEGLALCGVGDYREDKELDFDEALDGLPDPMPRLLLSHNPDFAEDRQFVASGLHVDLMLSGHTHGGQVRLPFVGQLFTSSRFGKKYAEGLVQGPACPVYVCRGLGTSLVPVRLGVRPEMTVVELRAV
jgi:predicted MPP superfamily phosphohydrolase